MGAGLVARVRHQAIVLLHPQAVERDPGPVTLQHASETRHTPEISKSGCCGTQQRIWNETNGRQSPHEVLLTFPKTARMRWQVQLAFFKRFSWSNHHVCEISGRFVGQRHLRYHSSLPQPRDPHWHLPHVLFIILAKASKQQPFFVARDVMQEQNRNNPHKCSRQ